MKATTLCGCFASLLLVTALISCTSSDSSSEKATTSAELLVPISDDLANAICSLTRYSSEQDLISRLGEPSKQSVAENLVALQWKNEEWSASAMWSDGELTVAGAHRLQSEASRSQPRDVHPEWNTPGTTLADVEAALGPGVRIGVQWHRGLDMPVATAVKRGLDPSAVEDRCSDRMSWVDLDMGGYTSWRFEAGLLEGVL